MAKIRNRRTIQGVVDELKLQREREAIPEEILTKIVPTFDVAEKGNFKVLIDSVIDDNDKTITVPDGQLWEIEYLYFQGTTTATVGNRIFAVQILDSNNNVVYYARNDFGNQTAGTLSYYHYSPYISTTDSIGGNFSYVVLPKILLGGWKIRVYDASNIDANDDIALYIHYKEFTKPTTEE